MGQIILIQGFLWCNRNFFNKKLLASKMTAKCPNLAIALFVANVIIDIVAENFST
jgi:hypothetical protein